MSREPTLSFNYTTQLTSTAFRVVSDFAGSCKGHPFHRPAAAGGSLILSLPAEPRTRRTSYLRLAPRGPTSDCTRYAAEGGRVRSFSLRGAEPAVGPSAAVDFVGRWGRRGVVTTHAAPPARASLRAAAMARGECRRDPKVGQGQFNCRNPAQPSGFNWLPEPRGEERNNHVIRRRIHGSLGRAGCSR